MATYSIDELRRAHSELSAHFVKPGHTLPADFETAMEDALWVRLLNARASINRYHASLRAQQASLYIHHGARDA